MARDLKLVEQPSLAEVMDRFNVLNRAHRAWSYRMWIGTLVTEFSNDELRLLADRLTINDTLTLRHLGLLRPDEGYDGTRRKRRG